MAADTGDDPLPPTNEPPPIYVQPIVPVISVVSGDLQIQAGRSGGTVIVQQGTGTSLMVTIAGQLIVVPNVTGGDIKFIGSEVFDRFENRTALRSSLAAWAAKTS